MTIKERNRAGHICSPLLAKKQMDSVHGWMRMLAYFYHTLRQTKSNIGKIKIRSFSDIFTKRLWPDAFPRLDKDETKNLLCLGIATRTLIGRSRNTNGVPALESRKTVSSLSSRFVCLLRALKCYVMELRI